MNNDERIDVVAKCNNDRTLKSQDLKSFHVHAVDMYVGLLTL